MAVDTTTRRRAVSARTKPGARVRRTVAPGAGHAGDTRVVGSGCAPIGDGAATRVGVTVDARISDSTLAQITEAAGAGIAETARTARGSQTSAPGAPVLIFEVDAAGAPEKAAPARRVQVRLIGSVRGTRDSSGKRLAQEELSAVLVLRALTPSRLLSCVRAVTRGGASMPPEVLCQMLPATADADQRRPDLAPREYEVLRLLADGDTTRDIAERLSYSERTVKSIVHDLLEKLNGRTRAHAVALAVRQGVI